MAQIKYDQQQVPMPLSAEIKKIIPENLPQNFAPSN
jgi:hypothetical protein